MYLYKDFKADLELLYNHLLTLRKQESPGEVVHKFYCLLLTGSGYPDSIVFAAVNRMVISKWAEREFQHILNRCCYILINHWWSQSEFKLEFRQATRELIRLFETSVSALAITKPQRCLKALVAQFTQSSQYEALRRRAWFADDTTDKSGSEHSDQQPIGPLIQRYPCLYPYYLLDEDTSDIGQDAIKRLQAKEEKRFEDNLLNYANHLFHAQSTTVENPTQLSPQQLKQAIVQFVGKAEDSRTYRESAFHLSNQISQAPSYQTAKQQIHRYLTASIHSSQNPKYGNHRFNDWLWEQLANTLPQCDRLKPNPRLIEQTCGQLLNAFVASPAQVSNHIMFVDLNNNLGATFTIELVLKIVLLCSSVRSSLEAMKSRISKQLAIIFKHYEASVRGNLTWLVQCLDNFMVAFAIHFGQSDFARWTALC